MDRELQSTPFMKNLLRYALFGFLWGIPIPFTVVGVDLSARQLDWSFEAVIALVAARPVHWFFLMHPLFFALVFGVLGRSRDRQEERMLETLRHFERASKTDGLTGLLNHSAFREALGKEMDRHLRRDDDNLSLVMLDIDHFKSVNDRFGHPAGDEVLKRIGKILAVHIRPYDIAARYGGEEFAVILPETPLETAMQLADRLRLVVEAESFAEVGHLTISIGVASLASANNAAGLVEQADAALYQSKRSGRNRVSEFRSQKRE